MTKTHPRHQQWLNQYYEQQSSGLSTTRWTSEQGISYKTYLKRISRLRELGLISGGSGKCKEPSADDTTESSSFFMIEVPPAPTVHTSKEHDNSIVCQIELTSGAKLSISNGIHSELLLRILEVVV